MIQIAQGLKSYEIKNENDELLGTITLNPSDAGIAARADEAKTILKTVVESMKSTTDVIEGFRLADKKIRDCFDYVFGCPISAIVFKNISALALTENGAYVFENIFEGLIPIVEECSKQATENSKKRVGKYVQGYLSSSNEA